MEIRKALYVILTLVLSLNLFAQRSDSSSFKLPELKLKLNADGSQYVKATMLVQSWIRYSELNPGSTIDNYPVAELFDIGIRRWRTQLYGQLSKRIFIYAQFGQNNFSFLQPRNTGAFLHDALCEFTLNNALKLGSGLTAWGTYSRFSAPAIGSLMGLEPPLYQQATNGVNDQFIRKMSVYAHGQINRLNYRIAASKPMTIASGGTVQPPISSNASWNPAPPEIQTSAYLFWQFFKKENEITPYLAGSYLGKMKLLNVGLGYQYQKDAMWRLGSANDTLTNPMLLFTADLFSEIPLRKNGSALHAYVAFSRFDFGRNYYRNNNGMNPANGLKSGSENAAGPGVSYPMIGTGNTIYTQLGYKFKDDLLRGNGSLMPYVTAQYSRLDAISDPVLTLEGGMNWFIHGTHTGKITLSWQNRGVYETELATAMINESGRRNLVVLQYQINL